MSYAGDPNKTRGENWPDTKLKHFCCTYRNVRIEVMAQNPYDAQMHLATSRGVGRGKINPRDVIVECLNV